MNPLKTFLRKSALLRWLDDWTDKPSGQIATAVLVVVTVLLLIVWRGI